MAFSLGELVVALTAGTDVFGQRLDFARKQLRDFGDDAERQSTALGQSLKGIAIAVGAIGGTAAAVFAAVNSAAQSVGALNDEVAVLGVSAEQFQRLAFAAKDFGVEQGELSVGLRIFTRNVGQAISAADRSQTVFGKLGIALEGVGGRAKSNQELINEFATALRDRVPNAQQRASIAVEAFGRSGARLVPLLSQGADGLKAFGDEAERLGFVLSDATVANADAAAEAFDRLTGAVGLQFKGALVELAPFILDLAGSTLPQLGTALRVVVGFFTGLKVVMAGLQLAVITLASAFGRLLSSIVDLAEFSGQGLKALAQLLTGDVAGAVKTAESAQGDLIANARKNIAGLKADFEAAAGVVGDSADSFASVDGVLAQLDKRFKAAGAAATEAAKRIRDGSIAADAAARTSDQGGPVLQTTSTEGANLLKKAEQDRLDRAAKLQGPLIEQAAAIQRQVDELRKAQLSDADRVKANAVISDLLKEQGALLRRQENAIAGLPELTANVQAQIGRLATVDPDAAVRFANELGQRLNAELGPEERTQALAALAQEVGAAFEQTQPKVTDAIAGGIVGGIEQGLSGGNGLQSFAKSLQAVGAEALSSAFKDATRDLGKGLTAVFGEAAGTLGPILTGIFGSVLGAVFNRTEVTSAAGNIQSAVDSAQQVRGVVAGPTSLGIAQVGTSIREAFRESERLLGIIARNTTAIAAGRRQLPAGVSALGGPGTALADESAALLA